MNIADINLISWVQLSLFFFYRVNQPSRFDRFKYQTVNEEGPLSGSFGIFWDLWTSSCGGVASRWSEIGQECGDVINDSCANDRRVLKGRHRRRLISRPSPTSLTSVHQQTSTSQMSSGRSRSNDRWTPFLFCFIHIHYQRRFIAILSCHYSTFRKRNQCLY